ncbi:MAG: hypothetical protein PWP64_135 [Candidatus Cloacimonadota bacterium]|nr:hypothetical protein [Candidatus Cloacimonadota bacterium]
MRMNFFFSNIFWGTLLVLWGVSLILKTFNIHLPLAKIFLAVIIIMFGIKLLIGTGSSHVSRSKASRKSDIRVNNSGEYNMIFSSGKIDLTDLDQYAHDIEINVIFGSAKVILPAHLNYDIEPSTIFGATVLPNKHQYGFGDSHYHRGTNPGESTHIESSCIFGRIDFVFQEVVSPDTTGAFDPGKKPSGASTKF